MLDYAFIVANAVALDMFVLGVIMLRSRRKGGLHFVRIGRFGGSFFVARK